MVTKTIGSVKQNNGVWNEKLGWHTTSFKQEINPNKTIVKRDQYAYFEIK